MSHHVFANHCCGGPSSPKAFRVARWVLFGIGIAVVFALIFSVVVQLLWNAIMPDLFGVKEITYLQAFGLIILAKILFGKGHPHPHAPHKHFKKWCGPGAETAEEEEPLIPAEHRRDYARYWEAQGKAAFEAYLRKAAEEKPEK